MIFFFHTRVFYYLENETAETQRLRQDLDEVRQSILNLESNTNLQNKKINDHLNEWQQQKSKLDEMRAWIDNMEKYISSNSSQPLCIQRTNEMLKSVEVRFR